MVNKIFPNPATSEVNISFETQAEGNVEIKVFDLNGKQVLQTNTATQKGKNQTSINIDQLISGVYFVHISGNKGDSSQLKFVKTK